MTYADFAPAARPATSFARIWSSVAAWLAACRAARARRIALGSLLAMDGHRLDDLGITPQDVMEAIGR